MFYYLGANAGMHTHMHMPWSERKTYVGMFLFKGQMKLHVSCVCERESLAAFWKHKCF